MHDDLLERQLRTALREEAGQLSFTITAAELERRAVLGGRRGAADRRLSLLLAAALAIGGLGAGTLIAGLGDPSPLPSAPVAVDPSTPSAPDGTSPPAGRPLLPSLDELIAMNRAPALVAQAHGPADGAIEVQGEIPSVVRQFVTLPTASGGPFRISVACLGGANLVLDVRLPGQRGPLAPTGPTIPCDGSIVDHPATREEASVSLYFDEPVAWRIVVRGEAPPLPPSQDPVIPSVQPEEVEELIRIDDAMVHGERPWGDMGLRLVELGSVGGRMAYEADVWCPSGDSVRLILGLEQEGGVIAPDYETAVACDGTVQGLWLGVPAPGGHQVFVAAEPGTRYSVLVSSERPPIELLRDVPGWEMTTGFGPHLSFSGIPHVLSGIGQDGGGQVGIGFVCAGSAPIAVTIDVGEVFGERRERFIADCTPEGATTFEVFDVPTSSVSLTYAEPPGTWTAQSFFVPEGSQGP